MDKYQKECLPGFTPRLAIEEASRCLLCLDAPCAKECPAATSPDKFIRSVRFRNFKGAAETIRANNALGAVCARVCPTERYCEKGCERSGIDRAIDIGRIQRFVTDYEASLGMEILAAGRENGLSIAIVGSGPSALQAAASLRQAGYAVDIYEKESVFGGMLRFIPEYRLPTDVVDLEIERIRKLGVKMHAGVKVGKDVSIEELKKSHDAVLIAVGLSEGKMLPMFEDNPDVILAIDFLREVKVKKGDVKVPDNVLVIGGGDVAMDVVATLKILGCPRVSDLVYEELSEFRASEAELDLARKTGATIIDGYVPVKVEGKTVTFKHRVIPGEMTITADLIILAVGQVADVKGLDVTLKNNEVMSASPYRTGDPRVFVCGDVARSPYGKTVVGGVRTGKEAALAIMKHLGGIS